MIKISLDESYVFDLLSIYEVKIDCSSDDDKKNKLQISYKLLVSEIIDTIGHSLYELIISSTEYTQLKESNKIVFDLVDRAHETELSKMTADANYLRYLNKVSLQTKFFDNTIMEVKI